MHCNKCKMKLVKGADKPHRRERHHVYPIRWWGRRNNKIKVLFCGECHAKLERIIEAWEDKIIALIMRQQGLETKPSKERLTRIFKSMKDIYPQLVEDYVQS